MEGWRVGVKGWIVGRWVEGKKGGVVEVMGGMEGKWRGAINQWMFKS